MKTRTASSLVAETASDPKASSKPRRVAPRLSKTRYVAGRQCRKRLWLRCFEPDKADPPGPLLRFLLDQGLHVDREARRLFPGGVVVSEGRQALGAAIATTRKLVAKSTPVIFEAAFSHGNVVVRADVLRHRGDRRWELIEVKSSTKVKPEHIPDLAIQFWVISACGLDIDRCTLMHVNKNFVYGEAIERFYRGKDVTGSVKRFAATVDSEVPEFMRVLELDRAPEIEMGPYCKAPQLCEFFAYCESGRVEHPIMQIPRIGKKHARLLQMGIRRIPDIPEDFDLTPLQQRVRQCVIEGTEFVGTDLPDKLRQIDFPVHYLDMETLGTAFPRYDGTHPYQAIPFQYSLHILDAIGQRPRHREYLHRRQDCPMPELARRLLSDIGDSGTLCTYTAYERHQIETLATFVPEHAEALRALIPRIVDLAEILRSEYYDPAFAGSFSIKAVAPVLSSGDMSYEPLDIKSGGEAAVRYLQLTDPATPQDLRDRLARELEEYCRHDTLALMRIHQALRDKATMVNEDRLD